MAKTWKIIRTDCEQQCPVLDEALLADGADLVLLPDGTSEDALAQEAQDADLILMCYTPIGAKVINGAARLKGIVKYGVGIDAIDIDAAMARGIPVVNVPDYGERTVAEGAFAMLIALAKRLPAISDAMQAQGWIWPETQWQSVDLEGKVLGLVGCGRIGQCMAHMAGAGFGMRVLGYDPHVQDAALQAANIVRCDELDQVLEQADFVSLHSVLTPETRALISTDQFKRMKPTAFLINTSRGALIDEDALLQALREGWIAGAGLDVFSKEPLSHAGHKLSPLYKMKNVLLHPHLTFFSSEAMLRLQREALARCREVLAGKDVLVISKDPRLRAQSKGVRFKD
ncbi:MAG: C-terminal binding protein [Pseudomonadota bacterium]